MIISDITANDIMEVGKVFIGLGKDHPEFIACWERLWVEYYKDKAKPPSMLPLFTIPEPPYKAVFDPPSLNELAEQIERESHDD